jgi:hypothetical protein
VRAAAPLVVTVGARACGQARRHKSALVSIPNFTRWCVPARRCSWLAAAASLVALLCRARSCLCACRFDQVQHDKRVRTTQDAPALVHIPKTAVVLPFPSLVCSSPSCGWHCWHRSSLKKICRAA